MNKEKQADNYLPYTHWRIKRILKNDYDCRLECICTYKGNRVPNYRCKYRLIQNYDNKVLVEGITMDNLRKLFTEEGYPLKDGCTPNMGAIKFLEYVNSIKNRDNED